jgi:hypothetical protein
MRLGQRFESARRLSLIGVDETKTQDEKKPVFCGTFENLRCETTNQKVAGSSPGERILTPLSKFARSCARQYTVPVRKSA